MFAGRGRDEAAFGFVLYGRFYGRGLELPVGFGDRNRGVWVTSHLLYLPGHHLN